MFKNRVREVRKLRKMTIQELADKIGRGFSTIQKLDAGTVDLDTYWMRLLSKALNCEPWELLPKDMQPKAIFYCGALCELNKMLEEKDEN